MTKIIMVFLTLLGLSPTTLAAPLPAEQLQLGVDRDAIYGPLLKNKKVALMVNQSSVASDGTHTLDKLLALQDKYQFKITQLFSVEHGIRGNEDAGFGDNDHRDAQSGLPIISLYGRDENGRSRAHPSAEQLQDVDIVIYDLQDVGVRSFTYTLSMHHLLESLQQHNKQLMVFDRPNPLGDNVYGPVLEEAFISGIGMHPIPLVHGLTSGEFALMIVNEGWLTHYQDTHWAAFGKPEYQFPAKNLQVIKMANYSRNSHYRLPKRPSPNLRSDLSIALYPSLVLFEATSVNMGRGSDHPFEQLAFSGPQFFTNTRYTVEPNQANYGWPQAGNRVYGERITAQSKQNLAPTIGYFVDWWFKFHRLGYPLVIDKSNEANYLDYQNNYFVIRPSWLAKVLGNDQLIPLLETATQRGLSEQQTIELIENSWQPGIDNYLKIRQKYRLYD